jgi:hypothetical protein
MLVAPSTGSAQSTTPAQPGLTDLNAAASASIPAETSLSQPQRPCRTGSQTQSQIRSQTRARHLMPRSRRFPAASSPFNAVIPTLHATQQTAPAHSYSHTDQVVAHTRPSRRRRPGNRTATHSKKACSATNLP